MFHNNRTIFCENFVLFIINYYKLNDFGTYHKESNITVLENKLGHFTSRCG